MPADAAPSFLWAATIPEPPSRLTLDADESHYLTRVCRARAGARVTLTDGRGVRAEALVVEPGEAALVEIARREVQPLPRSAVLLVGAPERGRADWMVEKLAELGVRRLLPVDTERGRWMPAEARLERWRRLARAALRQSRRCHELEVLAPRPLAEALADPGPPPSARFVADLEGAPAGGLEAPRAGPTVGLVGPAEGLSAGEREALANAGWRPISLSDGRLRTETAAMAWAAWWSAAAGVPSPTSPTAEP